MTFLVDDTLTGTSGQDLTTDGTTTFAKIGTGVLLFTGAGTLRNSAGTQATYHNTAITPPTLHRVVGVVSGLATLLSGFQAGISGRTPTSPSGSSQDCYALRVNATDATGNTTKLVLMAVNATGTTTTLVSYGVPSWGASSDKTMVLGLGIANTQLVALDGVVVACTFDTSVTRAGHAGINYGATTQADGTHGYQLTEWAVDDLSGVPTWSVAPSISGTTAQGSTLTCSPGTMSGGDTTVFQWLRSDTSGTGLGYTAIAGATGSTYNLVSADVGHTLICSVTRSTGAAPVTLLGAGINVTAATATVTGPAPGNGASPSIAWQTGSDPQAVGSVIVITPGTETNTPTTQTITLQRNTGSGWVTVQTYGPSAYPLAQQTYTTVTADAAAQMRVSEIATNAGGSSTPALSNILNVSPLALTATNLHWRLSGGATNSNAVTSIGGAMSSTDATSPLWDSVSGTAAASGQIDYRLLYLYNDHPTASGDAFTYILQQFSHAGQTLAIGLAAEGQNVDVAAPADRFTAPGGVSFSSPTTLGAALHNGTLGPVSRRGVWLRRTVTAGTTPVSGDPAQVRGDITPL